MPDHSRKGLNRFLFWLYEGHGRAPFYFRWAMLVFDFLTIGYFLWAPFEARGRSHVSIDFAIGIIIAFDLAARFYIARHKHRFFLNWLNWADFAVVVTMLAPLLVSNLAFLRVLRAVRAIRAFTFIRRMRVITPFFQRHEVLINKATNVVVFVFIMAAIVYATQIGVNPSVHTYIDALYFTMTTLTTTGYGDILMVGETGRLLSILIMGLGLTLFLQLLRAIVEPEHKVEIECPDCGLMLHDRDAIHCKHCGRIMHIETRGFE
ncbi:Potassium voltage-gated channel subfamily KQT; possible potassium channel, VIC family [hydrothermal vent metagenome]|uniref:Potassium voltage-gated channel subfamily KQT possible potassium channel, VIC family n=1 Tax=hydrothermal vent metagenome TaxID=652676 RepID=A0A3B0SWR2_9ZZZZ